MATPIFEYKTGRVWVSSYWTDMARWMKRRRVKVQVNCAADAAYDCPVAHVLRVNMEMDDGLDDRLNVGLISAMYLLTCGHSILIHSVGECRAGAFVVLLLGSMNMFEEKSETWKDAVDHAQATFAAKRSLSAVQNSENQQSVKKLMEVIINPRMMLETFRSEVSAMEEKAMKRALRCAKPKVGADPKARPKALPPQSMQSVLGAEPKACQSVQSEHSVQSVQSSHSQLFEVATLL